MSRDDHATPERRWRVTRPVPLARVYPTLYAAVAGPDEIVGAVGEDGRLYIVGDPVARKRSMREATKGGG